MSASNGFLSRRDFLATAAVLMLPNGTPQATSARKTVFLDQSGNDGSHTFVIGALFAAHPEKHLGYCKTLRSRTSYRLTLLSRSSDRHKIPFARGMLDYFFTQDDLTFAAIAYGFAPSQRPHEPAIAAIESEDAYQRLIRTGVAGGQDLVIYTQLHTTTGEDALLHDELRRQFARLAAIHVVKDYENDLIQLSGFLAGCIRRTMTNAGHVLVEDLAERLAVQSLGDPALSRRGKFRVMR